MREEACKSHGVSSLIVSVPLICKASTLYSGVLRQIAFAKATEIQLELMSSTLNGFLISCGYTSFDIAAYSFSMTHRSSPR